MKLNKILDLIVHHGQHKSNKDEWQKANLQQISIIFPTKGSGESSMVLLARWRCCPAEFPRKMRKTTIKQHILFSNTVLSPLCHPILPTLLPLPPILAQLQKSSLHKQTKCSSNAKTEPKLPETIKFYTSAACNARDIYKVCCLVFPALWDGKT